jgi:hypothetical protein
LGDRLGEVGDGDGKGDSSNEDDGVSKEREDSRSLKFSSPSLKNSTSHRLFLVRFAGGEQGVGDSAAGCVSVA